MNTKHFDNFPVIETERLVLKSLDAIDAKAFVPIAMYEGKMVAGLDAAAKILNGLHQNFKNKTAINWGMYLGDTLVGTCGFYRGFGNDIGEVGYICHPDHRCKGYTKEAVGAVVEFGMEELELRSIVAYADKSNIGSVKVLIQTGFLETESTLEDLTKFEWTTRKIDLSKLLKSL